MSDSSIENYISALHKTRFFADVKTPHSFAYMVNYYKEKAPDKRKWYRRCTTTVIALSAALPAVASFGSHFSGFIDKDVALSLMSAFIALLTGVLAHYRWELGWRSQNEALFALESLHAEWEGEIAKAQCSNADDKTLKELMDAFAKFRSKTFEIVHAEMGDFFRVQQVSDTGSSSKQES